MMAYDLLQAAAQFKQNPMAFLGRRFNIPQNMNNPQEIVQHLLNSGQITQGQLNNAVQMKNDPNLRNLFR